MGISWLFRFEDNVLKADADICNNTFSTPNRNFSHTNPRTNLCSDTGQVASPKSYRDFVEGSEIMNSTQMTENEDLIDGLTNIDCRTPFIQEELSSFRSLHDTDENDNITESLVKDGEFECGCVLV